MLHKNDFSQGLLNFLSASPTPFHAVSTIKNALEQSGFNQLYESQTWPENLFGKHYIIRNNSSIIAFQWPADACPVEQGLRIIGAHTDSPCLKIKPNPSIQQHKASQIGVEVYGGALLHPWFDRDLSIAGRVTYTDANHQPQHSLIDFQSPIALIPSLAIHLNRNANKDSKINPQQDITPILRQHPNHPALTLPQLIMDHLISLGHTVSSTLPTQSQLLDFELFLYDTQPPSLVGVYEDFICSARLDNLLSCYVSLISLLNQDCKTPCMLVCHDHEEVGSQSAHGANGHFLKSVLDRLYLNAENYGRGTAHSMMISVDNAHALHPNFPEKHDHKHGPVINGGPVIKHNANQRYATNGHTSSVVKQLAQQVDQPVQSFVVRNDMGCGSTIGPISSAQLGIQTLDMGVPQWAMHSIRETAGTEDAYALYQILKAFYQLPKIPSCHDL